MIVQCKTCTVYFDDAYRLTYCPHDTFAANDGNNIFTHYPDSYLSKDAPLLKWSASGVNSEGMLDTWQYRGFD